MAKDVEEMLHYDTSVRELIYETTTNYGPHAKPLTPPSTLPVSTLNNIREFFLFVDVSGYSSPLHLCGHQSKGCQSLYQSNTCKPGTLMRQHLDQIHAGARCLILLTMNHYAKDGL